METIDQMSERFGVELEEDYDLGSSERSQKFTAYSKSGRYSFFAIKSDNEDKPVAFTFNFKNGSRCKIGNQFEDIGFPGAYANGFISVGYWQSDSPEADKAYDLIKELMLK